MPELSYLINDAKACCFQRKGLESWKILEKRGQVKLVLLGWYQLSCTEISKNGSSTHVRLFWCGLGCLFSHLWLVCFSFD